MKLRNKMTGEIATLTLSSNGEELLLMKDNEMITREVKLSDLDEWEDCSETRYWYINPEGEIVDISIEADGLEGINASKAIGNYFETEEEAERAVEKLKAVKRLKDKGLHVTTFYVEDGSLVIRAKTHNSSGAENWEDLDLLFSEG